jgi:hypothetical protein
MHDDDVFSKRVSLEAVIDAGLLASLEDEQICDLFELLAAEVAYRYAMAPPDRCGLCLRPADSERLCARHLGLLKQALDLFSPGSHSETGDAEV